MEDSPRFRPDERLRAASRRIAERFLEERKGCLLKLHRIRVQRLRNTFPDSEFPFPEDPARLDWASLAAPDPAPLSEITAQRPEQSGRAKLQQFVADGSFDCAKEYVSACTKFLLMEIASIACFLQREGEEEGRAVSIIRAETAERLEALYEHEWRLEIGRILRPILRGTIEGQLWETVAETVEEEVQGTVIDGIRTGRLPLSDDHMFSRPSAPVELSKAEIIFQGRRARGYTQEQLADLVGLHVSNVRRHETGRSGVRADNWKKYQEILFESPPPKTGKRAV